MIFEGFLLWGDVGGGGVCLLFGFSFPIDMKNPLRYVRTLPYTGQWLLFLSLICLISEQKSRLIKYPGTTDTSFESVKTFKIGTVNTEILCRSVSSQI